MDKEPNANLLPLQNIENHINDAVRSLYVIAPGDNDQAELVNDCVEELKEFQEGNLLALRRAIEDG